jgi:hypothetical protein
MGGCVDGGLNQNTPVHRDEFDFFLLIGDTTADKFMDCLPKVPARRRTYEGPCTATNCGGTIEYTIADMDFAHTVVLNCPTDRKVSGLKPWVFECFNHKFILRSVILHSPTEHHFVSLNRHANGWMFYDGLGIEDSSGRRNPTIRYKNYPTELADEAMQGYNLDIAIYETVRKDEPRVDGNLHGRNDFTAHFAYENYTPPP